MTPLSLCLYDIMWTAKNIMLRTSNRPFQTDTDFLVWKGPQTLCSALKRLMGENTEWPFKKKKDFTVCDAISNIYALFQNKLMEYLSVTFPF